MTPTLIEHRNGTLYLLVDSPLRLGAQDRQRLAKNVAGRTGRQVLGIESTIPTRSSPGPGTNYHLLMLGFRTKHDIEVMRSVLRAQGITSPLLASDDYVLGEMGHLVYTEKVQLLQVQEPSSATEGKIVQAIDRSYAYMPAAVADRVRQFLTPENIALMAGTLSVYAIAHAFGIGFILDVILTAIAVVAVGTMAIDAFLEFLEFYRKAKNARSDADLEEAAKLFADVVMTIGVSATVAILTRRPLGSAGRREMDQAVLRRAMGPGAKAGAKAGRTLEEIRGKVVPVKGDLELFGPGAVQRGRAVNLTADNAFVLSAQWEDVFFTAAHTSESSLQFYETVELSGPIPARALAVRMFKAGYRGGDVVLLACEAGLNRGLVYGVWEELGKLGLERPVGVIHAPRRAIIGGETIKPHPELGWARWETFDFN